MSGLGDVLRGIHVTLPTLPLGHLSLDVHAQVGGPSDALLLAQLAVGSPRLVVDTDHALGGRVAGHDPSVAAVCASAIHPHPFGSLIAMQCLDSRDTIGVCSRAGP